MAHLLPQLLPLGTFVISSTRTSPSVYTLPLLPSLRLLQPVQLPPTPFLFCLPTAFLFCRSAWFTAKNSVWFRKSNNILCEKRKMPAKRRRQRERERKGREKRHRQVTVRRMNRNIHYSFIKFSFSDITRKSTVETQVWHV